MRLLFNSTMNRVRFLTRNLRSSIPPASSSLLSSIPANTNYVTQLLHFQALFLTPHLRHLTSTTSSYFPGINTLNTKPMDPDIPRILTFWFSGPSPQARWFSPNSELDAQIKSQFTPLIQRARSNSLDPWTSTPKGTLALLILLDQFPRNVFRNNAEAFSSDVKAREVATRGIAKGFDRELGVKEQVLFYLPLMHDEGLVGQIAGCALLEGLVGRCERGEGAEEDQKLARASWEFGKKHRDVILRFGRFPSRNEALGRKTTQDELEFLKEHPGGF